MPTLGCCGAQTFCANEQIIWAASYVTASESHVKTVQQIAALIAAFNFPEPFPSGPVENPYQGFKQMFEAIYSGGDGIGTPVLRPRDDPDHSSCNTLAGGRTSCCGAVAGAAPDGTLGLMRKSRLEVKGGNCVVQSSDGVVTGCNFQDFGPIPTLIIFEVAFPAPGHSVGQTIQQNCDCLAP